MFILDHITLFSGEIFFSFQKRNEHLLGDIQTFRNICLRSRCHKECRQRAEKQKPRGVVEVFVKFLYLAKIYNRFKMTDLDKKAKKEKKKRVCTNRYSMPMVAQMTVGLHLNLFHRAIIQYYL